MLDFDRFDLMFAENRIIRDDWTGTDAQGRETACVRAAWVAAGCVWITATSAAEAVHGLPWVAE